MFLFLSFIMAACYFMPIIGLTVLPRVLHANIIFCQMLFFVPVVIWVSLPLFTSDGRYLISRTGPGRLMAGMSSLCLTGTQYEDNIFVTTIFFLVFGIWYFGRYFAPWWGAFAFIGAWVAVGLALHLVSFAKPSWRRASDAGQAAFLGFFLPAHNAS